jgi:hypothetical protein
MPGTVALDQIAISLLLWTGCMEAAKTTALDTRSAPNSTEGRAAVFSHIDTRAAADALYCAGVESAPAFKHAGQNKISFHGVPEDSPVRRYA